MTYEEIVIQIEQAIQRRHQNILIARLNTDWAETERARIDELQTRLASMPESIRKSEEENIFRKSFTEADDVPTHATV